MIVDGRYTFVAPRETVYALLQDPSVLVKALPGAQALERTGDDRFEGVMAVGVGPVTAGEFSIRVELYDKVPPDGFAMRMDGKGAMGFVKGAATVTLTEEEGKTVMVYKADLKIGGKIAGVGQRLLDSVSKAMTKQGLEAVNRELQEQLAATAIQGERALPAPITAKNFGSPRVWLAGLAIIATLLIGVCRGVL